MKKDIENTDKIDMSEINDRYTQTKDQNKKKKSSKDNKISKVEKEKTKKNSKLIPIAIFLVTILIASTIFMLFYTLSSNRKLNSRLNELSKPKEVTEAKVTEPTKEETKPTEKETEENSEELGQNNEREINRKPDNDEVRSGRLSQDLYLRAGPGYDYDVIDTMPKGTEVQGQIVNGWLRVEYNGKVGYTGPQYLE